MGLLDRSNVVVIVSHDMNALARCAREGHLDAEGTSRRGRADRGRHRTVHGKRRPAPRLTDPSPLFSSERTAIPKGGRRCSILLGRWSDPPMSLACLAIVASTVVGWPDITVQPSRGDRALGLLPKPARPRPTDRSDARYDQALRPVAAVSLRNRSGALQPRQTCANGPEPELVYALAELCWVEGRRLDKWRKSTAIDYYLDAVAYAHDFLTDPSLIRPDGQRGSDPRYRTAMDLYNAGLERILRAAQAAGPIMPDGSIKLKIRGQEQVLHVSLSDSAWAVDDVDKLILASDYEVSGLISRTYHYGIGVP